MSKQQRSGWHWPVFEAVLCGSMTDRERLGLPDHYLADRYAEAYPRLFERLRRHSKEDLTLLCEDAHAPLIDRLVAGHLLAIIGDPRIETFAPHMVRIPGGTIEIGLATDAVDRVLATCSGLGLDRRWIAKECPRHVVDLQDYAIGKYPVTNVEYRDFLIDTRHPEIPTSWAFRRFPAEIANHPVYTITADAADQYCQWLSARTGRSFRLPTEAEWEYAAAGPAGSEFPWGADFNADYANTAETGLFQSNPVGAFVEGNSVFGLADMAGNVEEYVADSYAAYPGGDYIADHLVEIHGSYRIARGGSFARFRDLARTHRRHGHNPRSVAYAMGFRLAEDIN